MKREPKPSWHEVPAALRDDISAIVGEPIVSAEVAWGGFGPTASFKLTTAAGRTFFCKGTHPGNTPEGHKAVLRECANLRTFHELARFGPSLLGLANLGDWHMAVLEFVPRAFEVPPWTREASDRAIARIAEFHASTPERAEASLVDMQFTDLLSQSLNWYSLRDTANGRQFASLFVDEAAAAAWLAAHLDRFTALADRSRTCGGPRGWMHADIRSDNLIFAAEGRLLLVDWPVLSFGPQILDIALFLPSLEGEGGPNCADGLRLYEDAAAARFDGADIAAAAAAIAGFFAARAGQPEIEALPRLRWVQKLQLFPALRWLAQCLDIAPPPLPRDFTA